MPLDQESLKKLTTTLASDLELYNKVMTTFQEKEKEITDNKTKLEETENKLKETEKKNHEYLGQISNLLSKIPVGEAHVPQSYEEKIEEIKNRDWARTK